MSTFTVTATFGYGTQETVSVSGSFDADTPAQVEHYARELRAAAQAALNDEVAWDNRGEDLPVKRWDDKTNSYVDFTGKVPAWVQEQAKLYPGAKEIHTNIAQDGERRVWKVRSSFDTGRVDNEGKRIYRGETKNQYVNDPNESKPWERDVPATADYDDEEPF